MEVKRYSLILTLFCATFVALFILASIPLEPLTGSETRIGGYLETEYGWNKSQQGYLNPQFLRGKGLDSYSEPFDLIVVGDSFSDNQHVSWLNHVSVEADLHSLFLDIDHVDIVRLLGHPIFLRTPPQYLIVESTEGLAFLRFRRIFRRLKGYQRAAHYDSGIMGVKVVATSFSSPETVQLDRETATSFIEKMRLGGDFIMKSVERFFFGEATALIREVQIDCDTCFSNSKHNYFLVHLSTFDKTAYKLNYLTESIMGLERLKKLVESNNRTQLFSIVFPSKINVYLPYTNYKDNPTIFVPEFLSADIGFINLLQAFGDSVSDKITDIYLPNDHHNGSTGYVVAAREVLAAMGSQTELNPNKSEH